MEPKSIDRIFWDAAQLAVVGERDAYLDRACGTDGALRRRVEDLLQARSKAESFLEAPAVHLAATLDERPLSEGPGTVIGPYKLMEQLGEGGMGLVFAAQQQHPVRRRVALKVIKPGMDSRQVIARFEAERQALALMDHPHIARVFDGGESAAGRPYFVMELVKGVPITGYCDDNRLTPRARLELFGQVCAAVQHAHQKGVIHRDLKPSNVLVTAQDGAPLAKVINFGVAKAVGQPLTDRTVYTQLAQLVGTPLYMSPEQAGQGGLDVDTRTDIYALGVLLYELLTGTTPFERGRLVEAGYDEMRRILREEEPPRPSTRIHTLGVAATAASAQRQSDPKRLSQLCRGELDWVVMKALEKDRNRRYETAGAFAADVRRFLVDEPVQACPASRGYRLRKGLRKHRGAVVAAAAFAGLLLAGAAVSTVLAVRAADAERDALAGWADAERKGAAATKAQRKAVADRIRAEAAEAEAKREVAKAQAVKTFLVQGVLGSATAWSHPGDQAQMVKVLDAATHNLDEIFATQPEAEAAVRLTVGELYYSVGLPAKAEKHLRRGLDLRRAGRTAPLDPLKTADAETLYAMKHLGTLLKHRGSRGNLVEAEPLLRLSEQGLRRAEMRRIPYRVPKVPWTINVLRVAFSPDSRRVLAGGDDACMRLYDVATGIEVHRFVGGWIGCFSPDGRRILSGGDKTLRLWDAATARELRKFEGHTDGVASVVFSPDGRQALSASHDKTIRLWDVETGAEVRRFQGHRAEVSQAVFTPDGRRVLSGSGDGTVRLWDVDTGKEIRRFQRAAGAVWSVAVSPDGRRALSCDHSAVRLWDVETGEEIRRAESGWNFGWVAFAPDGHRALLTDHFQRKLRLWDVDTGRDLKCFSVEMPLRPHSGVISPDGRLAACGNWRGAVSLWRLTEPPPPDQALTEARQRLESTRREREADHADTLAALHDLGALLWDQGKPAEAEPLFRQRFESVRRVRGDGHAETRFARRELAALFQAQGKTTELAHAVIEGYIAVVQEAIRLKRDCGKAQQELTNALLQLAAIPDRKSPNPKRTVELAEQAVKLAPNAINIFLTLGFAQFRAGNWQAALDSMEKSVGLRNGGDPAEWFSLAMIHWQLGDKAKARQWYEKANQCMEKRSHEGWPRLRAEAAEVLGRLCVVRRFNGHTAAIHGLALSADGRRALTGSFDGTLRRWNMESAKEEHCLKGHTGWVLSVALTADGSRALSGGADKTVRLWDVDKGEEIRQFPGPTALVESVAFSPDGNLAVAGSQDKTVRVWEIGTGKELHCLTGHEHYARCVSFSPDGKQILSGSFDKTMRLWCVATGKELRQFKGHSDEVVCVAFSADGSHILSGSHDRTLRLWDAKTGEEVRRFDGHTGCIQCLALSADGRRVVSGASDATARVWDVKTAQEIYRFDGHVGEVFAVAFSANGDRVLSGCGAPDRLMLLWELPPHLRKSALKK